MASEQNDLYWNQVGPTKKFSNPNLILENPNLIALQDSILDVGCGYGRTLIELKAAGYENLFGIDSSAEMIQKALTHSKLSDASLSVSPAEHLPFGDDTFNAVLLFALLNCLPETDLEVAALKEAKRVLKKGGYLFVNDFVASDSLLTGDGSRSDQYGAFGLLVVDGRCVMRHTTLDRMRQMAFGMEVIDWKIKIETSMNGNPVSILSYILKKTAD